MEDRRSRVARLTRLAARPAATVLLCTYNDERTLADALDSALDQTCPSSRYRVLVVDDGSSDATPQIVEDYRRRHGIEVLRLPSNQGLAAACNAGLEWIDTPLYVRLDADDRFEPQLVERLLSATRGANFIYSDRYEVAANGARTVRRLTPTPEVSELIAAGVLLPTDLVRELGGYRDLFWEEFDLFLRLLESGRCRTVHVPEPLYAYTVGEPGRMTSDAAAMRAGWARLRELWPTEILERHGLAAFVEGVPGRFVPGT